MKLSVLLAAEKKFVEADVNKNGVWQTISVVLLHKPLTELTVMTRVPGHKQNGHAIEGRIKGRQFKIVGRVVIYL